MTPSLVVFSFKMHWYINSLSKQCPSRGQVSFCRQLNLGWSSVFFSDRIQLLRDFIMLPKVGKQLELTLTLFLLNILWNLFVFRKCLSIRFRKVFPMFVCFHVHAVWWIKPYYLSLPYFLWRCQILLMSKIFFVPTRRQCVGLGRCGIIKCCFIGWNIVYLLRNSIWQCLDDIKRIELTLI